MNLTVKKKRKGRTLHISRSLKQAHLRSIANTLKMGFCPLFSEEERNAHALKIMFEERNTVILSVHLDDEIVGGAAVKDLGRKKREIVLFFIASKHQGKHLGRSALKMIEDTFPETEIWQLVAPTEVLRNAVFYVNKCGYHIVRIDDL